MKKNLLLLLSIALFSQTLSSQTITTPEGRRIREIVAEKWPDGGLLIGGTTGSWAFGTPTGDLLDMEFSYVTPENDFKQAIVRSNPNAWDWSRADAWLQHIIDHDQVIRIHGPISPQCSNWAKDDSRTAQELSTELDLFMTALCQRYNGVEGIKYLDVVNEIALDDGQWFYPKPGIEDWENPWLLIGQDTDPNQTPLYIKQAFAIANQYAPDLKQIINNHCHPGTAGMEKVKETAMYLRDLGYRVDGIGWQAHINVGWSTEGNLQHLRDLIDWCHERELEFHITEFDAWITTPYTQTLESQANDYKRILDVLIQKQDSITIGWNAWHVTDATGWLVERKPSIYDDEYKPKPAYYGVQLALEAKGDYTTPYDVSFSLKDRNTNESIAGATVEINGFSLETDEHGLVTFTGITAGRYMMNANKQYMIPVSERKINVYSDTSISVLLEQEKHSVTFHASDTYSGNDLPTVQVKVNSEILFTNSNGSIDFSLPRGNYTVEYSKDGYTSFTESYEIISDTVFNISLQKTYAYIKFRLRNGEQPLINATVSLNSDIQNSNAVGVCTFSQLALNTNYTYSISKENFRTEEGSFVLLADTTLEFKMEKTIADVEFVLDESGYGIINGMLYFRNDSAIISSELSPLFTNIPKGEEYTYIVSSENYPELEETFLLRSDTTITISLETSKNTKRNKKGSFNLYPNPAKDVLFIEYEETPSCVELISSSGVKLRGYYLQEGEKELSLSGLPAGIYILRVTQKTEAETAFRRLIVIE